MSAARDLYLQIKANGGAEIDAIFKSLKAVGGQSKITAADLSTYEAAVKAGVISTRELLAAQEAVVKNEKRASDELQRYGQMQARAEQEDRRRTSSLNAQAAAQERLQRSQGINTARGLSSFANVAGVLPGGVGTAITGTSSLLGAGVAAGAVAGTAALLGAAAAAVHAANSLGEYARQQTNLAERTGLTTTQTQLFSRAAGVVDVNAGTLTISMRTLSKALSENSDEGKKAKQSLAELGLSAVDSLRPMGDLLPIIFQKLAALPDGAEKDRLAISLFGRSALELIPLINEFDNLTGAVKRSGVVIDEEGIKKALAYQREVKELGLAWDATVNKFKQAAVGVISFEIKRAKAVDEFILYLATGGTGLGVFPRIAGQFGDVQLPVAPTISETSRDPSQIRGQQRGAELEAIHRESETPRERIDARIKSLRDELKDADSRFLGAAFGAPKTEAESGVRNIERQLRAAEAQRDALKDGKRASEETLRLREELLGSVARELSGEEKITAEYDKQVLRLKDKKEATPQNLALAAEIRDVNLERYRQRAGVAATESGRKVEDAQLEAEQQRVRGEASRKARLAEQAFSLAGDEKGGIEAAASSRIESAKQEYEFTKARAQLNIQDADREHERNGDDLKYLSALTAAQTLEIQARGRLQTEIDEAHIQRQIASNSLDQKNRQEADKAAEDEIRRQRTLSDLTVSRARTIAEGQTRLAVVDAAPGFGLQAELNADAKRLAFDQQQAAKDQARFASDIATLQGRLTNDPKKDFELNEKIKDLRVTAAQEAQRIENDTIKARFDAEIRIAEKRKSEEQAFRQLVVGFVDAARTGHAGDFSRQQANGLLDKVIGNVAGLAFPTVDKQVGGISQRLSGTADDPTFIGKLLAGTPFGAREKNPVDANTNATIENTRAILTLTQTQTAIATGQPLPGGQPVAAAGGLAGIPGVGIFGSDTNGFTGQGALGIAGADVFGNAIPNPNLANQESARAALGLSGTQPSGQSFGGIAGLTQGFGHTGDLAGIFTGVSNTPGGGAEGLSGSERAGAAIATAGVVYAGVTSAIKDFSKGGGRGISAGIGDIAGTAAALDPEPISKAVLAGVALGSKVVSALFGDPKEERRKQQEKELNENVYQAPVAQNRTQDIFGNFTDYDKFGKFRSSDLSAIPQITEPYITRRDGTYYDVPGQTPSPFGGGAVPVPATPPSAPPATFNLYMMDAQSGHDYVRRNPDFANTLIAVGLTQGNGGGGDAVRRASGVVS